MCRAFEEMREEGEQKEQRRYSQLILLLLKEGKQDILARAAENPESLKHLYQQYNLL